MLQSNNQLDLVAYAQNWETFRSLNGLMWQIPIIAMTLTGGLWFGVSTVKDMPYFSYGLLGLAGFGNLGLILVLFRLRHIMQNYLNWAKEAHPAGYVSSDGGQWHTKSRVVSYTFQIMLLAAAVTSFLLLGQIMSNEVTTDTEEGSKKAIAFYDRYAIFVADSYEAISFQEAHPELAHRLTNVPPLRVLDVGSGSGRDAAAVSRLGHQVFAVEPSAEMLKLAKGAHLDTNIVWISDRLPKLKKLKNNSFDVVILSAVWMHIPPTDREEAFDRISSLLSKNGLIYLTLRLGPPDSARGIWSVNSAEVERMATRRGFVAKDLGIKPDLLNRSDVQWKSLLIYRS